MKALVTKLNDNFNGLSIGELRIYPTETSSSNSTKLRFWIQSATVQEITAVGGNFLDSNGDSIGDTMTIAAKGDDPHEGYFIKVYTDDSVEYVSIPDKYSLRRLKVCDSKVYIRDLQYCSLFHVLQTLSDYNCHCVGTLKELNALAKCIKDNNLLFVCNLFYTKQTDIKGSFDDLVEDNGFYDLRLPTSATIYGNIVDFINRNSTSLDTIVCKNINIDGGDIGKIKAKNLSLLNVTADNAIGGSLNKLADTMAALKSSDASSSLIKISCTGTMITLNGVLLNSDSKYIYFDGNGNWSETSYS